MSLAEELSGFGFGLAAGVVKLKPFNPRGSWAFTAVKNALSEEPIELHHIGSTAVKGLHSKPVLDVLGLVESLASFDKLRSKYEEMGFTWEGEHGIPGRRYLTLRDAKGQASLAHLHVFQQGSETATQHIKFRDRLNANAELVKEYDKLKFRLAKNHAKDREAYTSGKADFISAVLAKPQ